VHFHTYDISTGDVIVGSLQGDLADLSCRRHNRYPSYERNR
jgi:hypothetical protein